MSQRLRLILAVCLGSCVLVVLVAFLARTSWIVVDEEKMFGAWQIQSVESKLIRVYNRDHTYADAVIRKNSKGNPWTGAPTGRWILNGNVLACTLEIPANNHGDESNRIPSLKYKFIVGKLTDSTMELRSHLYSSGLVFRRVMLDTNGLPRTTP